MRTHTQRRFPNAWILLALGVFLLGAVSVSQRPFLVPAAAKGMMKSGPVDDSSDSQSARSEKKDDAKKEETKRDETSSTAAKSDSGRADSSTPRAENSAVYRTTERRDNGTEDASDTGIYKPGQVRDAGTPDVRGQIVKRDERRAPDYRYRKHYDDSFYHPYDSEFSASYPYYDQGTVVIIEKDRWEDRPHQWRGTYEYRRPAYGSLEEALVDIEATWIERDAEFLMWHVDPRGDVDIYLEGKYSHTLSPRQVYKLTAEAIHDLETVEFHFADVSKHGYTARARARHEYIGPDRRAQVAYLTYYLEKVRERWVIDRIDIRSRSFGAASCFIATAAYGSPMEKEVLALREFRDRRLLTNRPGRLFVTAYYKASPPLARWIAGHESARAFTRIVLKPVVYLCRLAEPAGAR